MKKILTAFLLLFAGITVFSQDLPFSKLYLFDQTLLNPAIGARYDFLTVKLSGSEQWVKLPKNPQTQALSFNMKLKNKMGFNGAILNENYGVVGNTGIKLSYFYYTKLNTKGDLLSFGISLSAFNYSFNTSELNPEEIDPALTGENLSAFIPNAGLGVYYQKKDLSLGFSAANLIPYKPNIFNTDIEPTKTRSYYVYGEYRFKNEINTFAVVPSVLFNLDEKFNREINLNAKLIFNNAVWLGFSYRDALSGETYAIHNFLAIVGFNFFKRLNIAYGYDFGLFSARNVMGGSHNFLVGYNFIKIDKDVPMYF
ncbi:MAG: PorP/SprF family type IX secretion system membrane protein [Bacteroidales bacterium]|nr:PorP/SprF family type IX secretion system membrane protein [Bacteroidales bacterium]